MVLLAGMVLPVEAGNILVNPTFSGSPAAAGWTQTGNQTWWSGGSQALVYPGDVNSMWMQGIYNGYPYISTEQQTIACAAGSTFTASASFSQYVTDIQAQGGDIGNQDGTGPYVSSGLFGADTGGEEDAWVEVSFLDANNNVLADYKSTIVTPTFEANLISDDLVTTNFAAYNINGTITNYDVYLNWINCAVTNQYDPTTVLANTDPASDSTGVTNTLGSGQYLVSPAGTANVRFSLSLFQAQYESGASYWDNCSLVQVGGPSPSVVGNLSPDGSHFFNGGSTNFTFTITSAASGGAPLPTNPTNGVSVVVNGVNESSSLQFSGNLTGWTVTLPNLTSNSLYSIAINVTNSAGLVSSSSANFDTFGTNNFIVSVEDYDFNGGQFIQNPIPTNAPATNSYWGTAGTLGIDQSCASSVIDGGSTLAPAYPNRTDGNVAFQQASDIELPLYAAQDNANIYNVAISYNNGGDWLNYTRNPYPSGNYFVYARISGGQGYGAEYLNILTSGYGTDVQTTNNLGAFVLANGVNWGNYYWVPLTDSFGNQVIVNVPPGQQTLQLVSDGGVNVVDFMFVPAAAALPPAISQFNPTVNSQNVFVASSNLTFTVSSSSSTIATNKVHVLFNGADVSGTESFTGTSTNWTVSVPLPANEILTMNINATDSEGLSNSVTETFDTFSQSNFMFEAVDFDFAGGQFIDNPVPTGNANEAIGAYLTDSYYWYPEDNSGNVAVPGVDYTDTNYNAGETYLYRPEDLAGTQVTTDFLRQKFINDADGATPIQTNSEFNIGWWNPGTWLNYTRTFPTNTYYVYGRLASGAAYTGLTLSQVTSGQGTPNQTTQLLGSFADSAASGYQNWHWVPLLNSNNQMVVVSLGGVETLRLTGGTGANAEFYMLVPAVIAPVVNLTATISGGNIQIQFPTQNGSTYTLLYSDSVNGGNWQPVGSGLSGNGSIQTVTDSLSQTQRFYRLLIQ